MTELEQALRALQVLDEVMRRVLDESAAVRDNLTATQQRCDELLEENRALKRRVAELKGGLDILLGNRAG